MSPEHKHPETARQELIGAKAKVEVPDRTTTQVEAELGGTAKREIEQKSVVEMDQFDINLAAEEDQWETDWLAVEEYQRDADRLALKEGERENVQLDQEEAMELDEWRRRAEEGYDYGHYEEEHDDYAPVKGEEPWTKGVCA